jgi:ribosomal protein S18 acetylase RimI-like enzyme
MELELTYILGGDRMIIMKATVEDAEEILDLQKSTYLSEARINEDYSIPPLTQTIESLRKDFDVQTFLKAIEGHRIIGSVKGYEEKGTCYIGRLIVADEYQNRGIGTMLLKEIEKEFEVAARYELFTGKKSDKNLYLYQKNGYRIFREDALNDKTTIVYMEKNNVIPTQSC